MLGRTLCLAALLLGMAGTAAPQAPFAFDATPGLLSRAVRPVHYTLALGLDPEQDAFDGEATISLQVRSAVPAIVLHAHDLTAGAAWLLDERGERRLDVVADATTQTWRLQPLDGAPVEPGTPRLRLSYRGRVQSSAAGLYRAPLPGAAPGRPARMLATQLEAIHARTLFPAFDEPAFRAVFELTVRTPMGYDVVSNMPATVAHEEAGRMVHRFAPTPPMPSYLLAVTVGRFDALAGEAAGVPLRVLTAPGKREHGAYAMEATRRLLPYYTDYFGVPYALPKLDQLAVPSGRWGAMEDWGLISYAENLLLYDPATSDPKTQRRVFGIVAHEVAHQWFGNLVTAASWDEIWLNEAFATWLAEKATHRFNPQWQVPLRRRAAIDEALEIDAGPATRPIRGAPVHEDRVFDVFDEITYTKGGAVLSMLEGWIGPETFRRGIAAYVQARRLSNATAGDLWRHVGEAARRDVAAVASSWTDQPGFPQVDVASRCVGGRTLLQLAQRRFGEGGAARWSIPLRVEHGGRVHALLLERARQTLALPGCGAAPPLVNPGGEGFYRVAYAAPLQAAHARRFDRLPAPAAVTLLSDTFAQVQAGRLPLQAWLDLAAALPRIGGPGMPALHAAVRERFAELDRAFAGAPAQDALHAAARALLAPALARIGWDAGAAEDSETTLLRGDLVRDLAHYGDAAVVARAQALFDADAAGRASLPAGLRSSVVQAVAMHADAARFSVLLARLRATQREEDRRLYLQALAGVRDPALVRELLAVSLDGTLPPGSAASLPGMVGERGPHAALAYQYTVDHWPALAELAGATFAARSWLLPSAAAGLNRPEDARRLVADQRRLAGAPGEMRAARVAAKIERLAELQARESRRAVPALRRLAAAAPRAR